VRKRHRPIPQRLLYLVAGLLSVVVLLGSVGGFVVVKWFDGSIARVKLNLGKAADRPAAAPLGSQNWLLVGTDSRAGTDGEFGTGIEGARSDTTILAHLDADGTTTNISIPRDTLVTIPAYTDSKGVEHPAEQNKFNQAIFEGGPSLLVRTVEKLFQVQVDHYVSVDLEGFKKISQVINGVQVCIKPAPASANEDGGQITNINDGFSGFHGRYGEQTLVGDQAVDFVRQRHGLPDSDLDRIKRQQQFLGSVFRTATRVNLLFNPIAVTRLLGAIQKALVLDEGTSLTDLESLGLRLRGLDPSKVFFETLPQRGLDVTDTDLGTIDTSIPNVPTLTPNGQDNNVGSVQIIEQAQFEQMVAKIRDTGTSTSAPSTGSSSGSVSASNAQAVSVPVDPSSIQVTVEDGVGEVGLASKVTAALAKDTFPTGVPGPAATTNTAKSQVRYGSGDVDAARTVAAAVPGSVLVEDPSVTSGVVLVVGANFTKVLPVSVSDVPTDTGPTPTPTATPSPNPAPISADSDANRCTY
jgi:LCP family protein required for cell wall assembly